MKYYVELVSYEKDLRTIKDSHEIEFFETLEEAEKEFKNYVSSNLDKNYGYILGEFKNDEYQQIKEG